jgi:U3 small nucleolar RNA-associated protein 13
VRTDPLAHPPPYLLTGSQDYTIKKWEVPRQPHDPAAPTKKKTAARALFTRKAHEKDINALDVHHGGALFASASQDKTVKIWSLDGEVQGILRGHRRGVWSVSFAPAHTPAIAGEDGLVAAASAGARGVVLSASGDKTIKLWSLADYSCIRTFEGHANTVLKVVWLPPPAASSFSEDTSSSKRAPLFASAGGDGLVKVWDATSGEAACTLDNHDDRVWALATDPSRGTLASGSSDSTVTFWRDTSSETREAAAAAARALVEQEQLLENYMRADSYRDAIALALQLDHPGRLLAILTSVVTKSSSSSSSSSTELADLDPDSEDFRNRHSITGLAAVDDVLASLSDDQLLMLLHRLRDWNTNARAAPVAQRVLAALVRSYPAAHLAGLASLRRTRGGRQNVADLVHALRVYTERHYKRLDELVDESYLVEYTLREMDALAPEGEDGEDGEEGGDVLMDEALLGF